MLSGPSDREVIYLAKNIIRVVFLKIEVNSCKIHPINNYNVFGRIIKKILYFTYTAKEN
jgi:hypothetical protein